jgi:hypothetical protein
MQQLSDAQLVEIRTLAHGAIHDGWAGAEMARRQNVRLGELISALTDATNKVHQEVAILSSSSDRVERLTQTLKAYTIWLLA